VGQTIVIDPSLETILIPTKPRCGINGRDGRKLSSIHKGNSTCHRCQAMLVLPTTIA
jgi:hypothetical protein